MTKVEMIETIKKMRDEAWEVKKLFDEEHDSLFLARWVAIDDVCRALGI